MNYINATTTETSVPVKRETKTEPINYLLSDTQLFSMSSLVLLNKLHNFLFAENRPTTTPEFDIDCLYTCAGVLHDIVEANHKLIEEICERLGMFGGEKKR